MGDRAEHDQHREREQQLLPHVRLAEGVDAGLQKARAVALRRRWRLRHPYASVSAAPPSSDVSATGRGFSSSTVPPAALIFWRAAAVKRWACTVSGCESSPSPRTLSGFLLFLITPAASSDCCVTSLPAGRPAN